MKETQQNYQLLNLQLSLTQPYGVIVWLPLNPTYLLAYKKIIVGLRSDA
ncbi:MAG: hypothetical protein F6K17_32905 [Okeania sp. SIO3C4]|nr:hypothetical protein [Okeania sp. SIO3B3]NER07044.1 hypothetical protein [Okeania sp. SIO3C4]